MLKKIKNQKGIKNMKFEISRTSDFSAYLTEINSLEELLELAKDENITISKYCYFFKDEASYSIEIDDDNEE